MEVLNLIRIQKENYNTNLKGQKTAPENKLPQHKNDSIELSKNKKESKNYTNIIGLLTIITGLSIGSIYGGKEIYKKYFDKLACGIKKGEIDDALYNFIKNNDPKGQLFNDKATIIELSTGLNDDKLVILKQLAKMKSATSLMNKTGRAQKTRFTLKEIKSLLSETNEENIKYIEQLAQKSENSSGDTITTFSSEQILKILKKINNNNDKVAKQLIDITDISSEEVDRLIHCLKNINKDNIETWQILLSTRNQGGKTKLKLKNLSKLAKKLEETKNPKCTEILLNAQKKNGTGDYLYDIEDIISVLPSLKDTASEIYKKFHEIKAVTEIGSGKCALLLPIINEHNIDLVAPILTKKITNSEEVVFKNFSMIKSILESVDNDNKELIKELLDLIDSNYTRSLYTVSSRTESVLEIVIEKIKTAENKDKAYRILRSSNTDSFSKFVNEFFKPY